ncbi:MAG: SusC/RagA family TonB-linked outer membrane protein [Mucilaginibacter sp.]|uniref:SusC/RagA family TonB-linked outer membrane protein n=1 Tax=Mucilaginibacter sp. L3T2-6 TaxID=3062491 RepID=UPI002675A572|nr:SusC/RagA family TonB-linked outer membrane protein [Mucilaginibacter sp. L3T2-6]MDO3642140.1 SusC/RagA family TonB-linked outer membrane protein [Mucilaginibacter sp. L3T2-6]MDV6214634.1 SusC/RagA family TonB-linked outer membrane protein [Mucilaginibacter sp. L3T2-6]
MKQIYMHFRTLITALLFCLAPVLLFGQSKIGGTVTDNQKQALPGVSVKVKGTTQGTITDVNGRFLLTVQKGQVLEVSFLGFQPAEVPVTDQTNYNIVLKDDSKTLNEVVVTALGVKKETRRLGYSVQTVNGDALTTARDANPVNGLIGKVAGLSVGATSEVLGVPNVTIRGNTVTLYVVDGLPINSDTFDLSPDDIETYTILKGPAAAALYGNRAANGAILITTKKGNANKKGLTVDINSSTVINKGFVAFPRIQSKFGPGENTFYTFVDGKGGAPGGVDSDYDVWGPYFAGQLIPQYDSPVINGVRQGTPWVARGANNLANFLRTGYQTNNNIALTANGDTYTTRFSVSQQHQSSYIPSQYLDIANVNMFASFNPTSRLKFEASFDFNRQSTDDYPDVQYGPNSIIYNMAIWTGADWNVNAPDIKGIWQPGKVGTQSVFAEYTRYHNPWFLTKIWTRSHYKNDIYGYLSGNFKIDNHLNVGLKSQVNTYNLLHTEDMPYSAHPYGREGNQGDYREDRRDLFENNTELKLNFDYTAKKFLNISGLVGGNLRNFKYNSSWVSTDYLNVPGVYAFSNSKNPIQATSFSSQLRTLSGFYSVDLSFGHYATLSSTGRVDKSSAFQNVTTYYYPSISAATVISDYVTLPSFITFLKARASYSNVRSDATSPSIGPAPYSSITAFGGSTGPSLFDNPLGYGTTYNSPYNGPDYSLNTSFSTAKPYNSQTAGYASNYLYQTGIKTSTRVNYEEGLDIKFIQNRLGLSATAFQYIDGPRILANSISTATGYTTEFLNALKTKKTGYELSLSGTPVKDMGGFGWDVLVNWSTFKEIYDELPPGQTTYNTFFQKGDRTDKFYGTKFVRTPTGQIINGSNGEPLVNPVPQYLGHLNADYTWSVYNHVHYKSIGLGFQFDGSVGGVTADYVHNKTVRGGSNALTAEGALGDARYKDWQNFGKAGYNGSYVGQGVQISNGVAPNYDSKTGAVLNYGALQYAPNTSTAFVQEYASEYYNVTEANLMSKTYAKLREVTIDFTFPKAWLQHTFISKASASIYGRNLLYFYKNPEFKDVDLDQYANTATSLTGLQSPSVRSYGLNLKLSF